MPPLTIGMLLFRRSDVEDYEAETVAALDGGKTELMRLKRENKLLKEEVEAAIHMAFFMADRTKDGKKTGREEFIKEGLRRFKGRPTRNYLERTLWPKFQERKTAAKK